MTLSINMNVGASAFGGAGVGLMTSAGNPWSVADAIAQEMVNRGLATALNWPPALPNSLTAAQAAAVSYINQAANTSADDASTTLQAALASSGDRSLSATGIVYIRETLLLPSNTRFRVVAGTTLRLGGTYGRTMLRNGNACASGNLLIGACFVICADSETPSGTGTIRSVGGPARLYYTAPGDTEGAAVDVSGSDGKYTLTSAGGKSIYVSVARSYLNAGISQSVKVVSACDGAVSATWSRDSATLTIAEVGHTHRVGEAVTLFGASVAGLVYVETVSGNNWTISDTRGAGSGSCRAFATRNPEIAVDNGAFIDYDQASKTTVQQSCDAHAIIFNSATFVTTPGLRVTNASKYAFYATHVSGLTTIGMETPYSKSDGWHVAGPARNVYCGGMRGQDGDNLTALGNSDFAPYVINWTADYGSGDVIGATIERVVGNNNHTELCRMYSSTGKVFRDVVIRDISGTVDATSTSIVSIVTDTTTPVESAAEINIDGLTIERISAKRSDGGEVYVFSDISAAAASAGKRKNVLIRDVTLPDPMGDVSNPVSAGANKQGAIRVTGNYDSLTVERVRARLNLSNGYEQWKGSVVGVGNGAVIRALTVKDVKLANNNTLLPTANFSAVVKTETGATVTSLLISDVDTQEVNGSGTKATILYNNGGTVTSACLRNISNLDGDSIARNSSTGTLSNLTLDSCYANSSSIYLFTNDAATNINFNVFNIRGQFNSILNTASGGGTVIVRGAGFGAANFASGAGQFNGTYTGITLNVSGPEFVIALDNVAMSRTANKGNIVKAKAAVGTIPAGVLAVCDDSGAANSWKAVHNTTLVY